MRLPIALLLAAGSALNAQTTLVGWDFSGLTGYGSSPMVPTNKDDNLTVVGLTRGSGLTT